MYITADACLNFIKLCTNTKTRTSAENEVAGIFCAFRPDVDRRDWTRLVLKFFIVDSAAFVKLKICFFYGTAHGVRSLEFFFLLNFYFKDTESY